MNCLLRFSFSFTLLLAWVVGPSPAESEDGFIPFSQLTSDDRQVLEEIVRAPTLFRELKGVKFRSHKEVYEYLLDHPDFAAAVTRALNLSNYQIAHERKFFRATDRSYWGTDARGATGRFRVIYAGEKKRVFFLVGTYDRKWLPTISARAVMILVYGHKTDREASYVENDLYGYLKMDNPLIGLMAKLLQPVMGGAMEGKMKYTLDLAGRISEEAYSDPAGFLKKLETSPEFPRYEFDEFRRTLYANVR